jgi:predicted nucleic acid-binding protein
MCASEQRGEPPVVCDTVVVNYFLAIGRFDLLADVLGGVVRVPTAVFDPEEDPNLSDSALSELRRGARLHERRAQDVKLPRTLRDKSASMLPHFLKLDEYCVGGSLVAIPLAAAELNRYAQIRDRRYVRQFGVKAELGRGEAAMLAVASARSWRYATDDDDAIKVGSALMPDVKPWRIRGLLRECVAQRLCSSDEAQQAHREMVAYGFWDRDEL